MYSSFQYIQRFLKIGLISICSYCSISVIATTPVLAAKQAQETQQVSAKVGKPLKQARELMDQKKFKEALAKTQEVAAISGKTPAEEALVNEMLAYCMISLKDYAGAVAVYETMLNANQFKPEDTPKRILTMSQIYFALKNYPKSIQYGERYLKDTGFDFEVARQVSQAYYLQNNFARAGEYAINEHST
jgi:tetratricopeptide (TPR) repeat protein